MKLRKLKLKDFRGYNEFEIDFTDSMNVIIGRNDVGKSAILEALNIFFNDEIKPDKGDCNINSEDKIINISCCFEIDNDENIIVDATNPTSLSEEYLLNKEGFLEISKKINTNGKTITKTNISVSINARYPKIRKKPLITLKQNELKILLENYKENITDYDNVNKSKKADMRRALFNCLVDEHTVFEDIDIKIKDIQDDALKTWDKLKISLPLYTLFESDRSNTDGDREIQDPMKAITKEALLDFEDKLEEIKDEVVKRVEEIGAETIDKLKDFNKDIANELKTIPDVSNWDKLFKFSLDTDNGIPLNKRGSGIRRLVLLSYFRSQAEKDAEKDNKRQIIYAIEEPETSQHPDFQTMIIESLMEISQKETHQVIITTHTPEIAKMVDKDSLIFLYKDKKGFPKLEENNETKLKKIAKSLGIFPEYHTKLLICVEGRNDVNFLMNLNRIKELNSIVNLEDKKISIIPMNGCNLKEWIKYDYFKDFDDIKEFHLYDNDKDDYVDKIKKINKNNDGRRFGINTKNREAENYICPKLIERIFKESRGIDKDLSEYYDEWLTQDVPKLLESIYELKECDIKRYLNGKVSQYLTKEILQEHGVFEEIKSWFEDIKSCI